MNCTFLSEVLKSMGNSSGSSCSSSTTSSGKISTRRMELIVQKLINQHVRRSTIHTYMGIWDSFNTFLVSLDVLPKSWEARTTLFVAHLIESGKQSSSVKSYVSAIKKLLLLDGYKWKDDEILISSLMRACRLINDRVLARFPIHCNLLEMILFEVERLFSNQGQCYLDCLYKTVFILCYYGMMRVGEISESPHVLKARNVHIAKNKDKILLVLYTSKTYGLNARPQKIKITSNREEKNGNYVHRHFCPFVQLRKYLKMTGNYNDDTEQLFIYRDGSPLTPAKTNSVLKWCISSLGLEAQFYSVHCCRIGRTSDLIKFGYSIEEVKRLGRWKSNAVYRYIRD